MKEWLIHSLLPLVVNYVSLSLKMEINQYIIRVKLVGTWLGCARFAEILSELTKTWSSGARKYWTQKWIFNLTFISFLLFVYMSVFYNIVQILFTK